ncbi:MAG TPA: metallophosphoesterase, partial [Pirellulales bacterium]|nr:metallophosphoesterase [Pirellulales bacterium]
QMEGQQVEFALHLGDLVDDADNQSQWDELLRRAARHRVRVMPVVGNHDRMPDYNDHGEIRFRQYFPALPNTFYHFRHRGINFLMLNSERSLAAGSEQAGFLEWQLEHHPGTAIVCLHRPVFTSGQRDWGHQLVRRFWLHPVLRGGDTVAVLAGHNHYYDRTRPLDGITYVVSGGASSNLYPAEPDKSITAASKSQRNHWGLVEVYANCLQVRILDLAGEDLDRFCLPLKPTTHKPGGFHNPLATELPPLATLPDYDRRRVEEFTAAHGTLPRPW